MPGKRTFVAVLLALIALANVAIVCRAATTPQASEHSCCPASNDSDHTPCLKLGCFLSVAAQGAKAQHAPAPAPAIHIALPPAFVPHAVNAAFALPALTLDRTVQFRQLLI